MCDSGRGPGGVPARVLNVSSLRRLPQCGGSGTLRPLPLRKHHHGKCGDHPERGERRRGEERKRGVVKREEREKRREKERQAGREKRES